MKPYTKHFYINLEEKKFYWEHLHNIIKILILGMIHEHLYMSVPNPLFMEQMTISERLLAEDTGLCNSYIWFVYNPKVTHWCGTFFLKWCKSTSGLSFGKV